MDYNTLRDLDRDPVLYSTLRNAMLAHCKSAGITSYADFFADKLRYTSKTRSTQLLGSIQDHSTRKFSLDEFQMVVRELGTSALPVINRLCSDSDLVCVRLNATQIKTKVDFDSFALLNAMKNGSLAGDIIFAVADGKIDKKEKAVLLTDIGDIINLLATLREEVENMVVSND